MLIKKIELHNFRNYADVSIELNERGNLLFGRNGQGKTNLLESLYYLSVFRSFRKAASKDIVKWGENGFGIDGFFEMTDSFKRTISARWNESNTKEVFYENERVRKLSSMIGVFPAVLLSQESIEISQGAPGERRRFLDMCFSMVDSEYLINLISYRRVLKQRNRLLHTMVDNSNADESMLELWNQKLIQYGSYIIQYRARALESLSTLCSDMYSAICKRGEKLEIEYRSSAGDLSHLTESFARKLFERRKDERRRKKSLVGPHRDDLLLLLNGHEARKFCSQGQHKTILLALKTAELQYISEKKNVIPAILLDDLFALLDNRRIQSFLGILKDYSQFFITANIEVDSDTYLSQAGFDRSDFSQFLVAGGTIERRS